MAVLSLWQSCRDPAWGGLRHLPDVGGFNDQAAALMDAFELLEAAARPKDRDESGGGR